jgi:rubrerythrin
MKTKVTKHEDFSRSGNDATKDIETRQETKLIEREVVKVPCKYCGTLVDPVRNEKCPSCGGRIMLSH